MTAQSRGKIDTELFCDLKTDEEKGNFFLSGRGYETGVIALAIQNDVAMAYHRCSEYRKELEALHAECESLRKAAEVSAADANAAEQELDAVRAECAPLRAAIRRLCNIYVIDDYYMGKQREERLGEAVEQAIEKVQENQK